MLQAFAAGEIDALDGQGRFAGPARPSQGKTPLPVPEAAPPPQSAATIIETPAPSPEPAVEPPVEPPTQRLGQYRSDRFRRGAGFAWPKDVLDLMQSPPAPQTDELPLGVLVPLEPPQPHEEPAPPSPPPAPVADSQARPVLAQPTARPRTSRAERRERLLILQLVVVAAGAWASVLLAWLLL